MLGEDLEKEDDLLVGRCLDSQWVRCAAVRVFQQLWRGVACLAVSKNCWVMFSG